MSASCTKHNHVRKLWNTVGRLSRLEISQPWKKALDKRHNRTVKFLEDANKLEDGLASRHKSADMVAWRCSNFISFHLTSVEIKEIFCPIRWSTWTSTPLSDTSHDSPSDVDADPTWPQDSQPGKRWHDGMFFPPPEVIVHRQRCRALQALGLVSPGGRGQSWRVEKFSHRGGGEGERASHAKIWHEDRRRAWVGLSRAEVTGGGANVFTETFCVSSADGGCFLFVC